MNNGIFLQLSSLCKTTCRCLPPLVVLLASTQAGAWGRLGHEVAGEICESYLSEAAGSQVRRLLGDEPLAEASHWADRMRSDPAPFWQDEAGPYHYVTAPPGADYSATDAPPQGDAYTALTMFARELQDPQTPESRQQLALRFAVHIVQDLQQPLHAGNGRDRGGNDVAITIYGEPSNLHWLWDSQILDSAERSRNQWLRYLEREDLLRAPRDGDAEPLRWIRDSAALRETLYPPTRTYGDTELQAALPIAEKRLALAGIRCAAWLNANLPGTAAGTGSDQAPDATPERRRWWQRLFSR